jgi:hypothetical protein
MKAIFYFVDGFAWRYLTDAESRFKLADWPVARPLETVLGYSSSIVPVLLSGKLPVQSGLWTEYYRDDHEPSAFATVARTSKALATPLNMARLVAFRIARQAGWQEAHRLRIPIELSHHFKRHPIDYMRMPPCSLEFPTVADLCAELNLRMSFSFIGDGDGAARALAEASRNYREIDVLFLYDCTIDHAGHHHGPDVVKLAPYLDRVTATVERLRLIAGLDGAAEILLFSDHGMTAVMQSYDIFAALSPLRIGSDFLAFPDSTFARFWYPTSRARSQVRDLLRSAPGTFLTEAEAVSYGVPYPDPRYGEDVLIANEGVVFHPSYISPSFFRRDFPDKGMHGYRPQCESADGVVLYSGNVLDGQLGDRVAAASVFDLMSAILKAAAS